MIVNGVQVPKQAMAAVEERMRGAAFECRDLIVVARSAWPGAPMHCADRLADRLIQREARAGRIVQVRRRVWQRAGATSAL